MYAAIENRAYVLCLGILIAIAVLGQMFGGALYGLIPLGMCVSSGVFLWMKDLVRSGRETEWASEQERGETVRSTHLYNNLNNDMDLGHGQFNTRIS
jgi:hypothetical protein